MATILNVNTIKPGEIIRGVSFTVVSGEGEFEVLKDDVIFLAVTSETANELTFYGGNTVLGGGDKKITLNKNENNYICLEGGPYAQCENGKSVIRFSAASPVHAAVIQAV